MHLATNRPNDAKSRPTFRRREWLPAAHLFALWASCVAQPVLDLVDREPDFLAAHHLTGGSLAAMVIGLALGILTLLAMPTPLPAFRRSRAGHLWTEDFGDRHRVLAVMLRGVAVELPYPAQASPAQ